MITINEPEVLAKQIWKDIDSKDSEIKNGEIIDLSGIESQVKAFCELLGALPREDALKFEEDLKRIMDKLIDWSTLLEERKRQVFQGIRNLNTQTKAQTAYMTTSSYKPDNNG